MTEFRDGLAQLRKAAEAQGRPWATIEISLRFGLSDELLAQGPQAVVDQLGEYKRLGARHALVEFRRPDLARCSSCSGWWQKRSGRLSRRPDLRIAMCGDGERGTDSAGGDTS